MVTNQLNSAFNFLTIEYIHTIYYFEFSKDYAFPGEKHDSWELVYVDNGLLEVVADNDCSTLQAGDIIFHQPNEFHQLHTNGEEAANVIVISFTCRSAIMALFEKKIMSLSKNDREMLAAILNEAKLVFKPELGRLHLKENRLEQPFPGAEQMIYIYLTQFLISLVRDQQEPLVLEPEKRVIKKTFTKEIVNNIVQFMEEHLSENISIDQFAAHFYISSSYLKKIFKDETEYSIITYFKTLKMEQAKKWIREDRQSFTEIASLLGFDSIHHFSNSFKKYSGFSPTSYANSVKSIERKLKQAATSQKEMRS
ncbi:AraC family transcriptional regulator [uncultured Vagococcus sp.]|uniref:AraC family transcriptional regulator n=1 Tax=uncultured Vagococcus sp. TaxID=189676 RepID=UPI0028D2D87A|nr:AraC family transcriptional regulator [uncultured Vagococcus sp.]